VPLLAQRLTSVCSLQAEPPLTSGTFPGLSKEIWRASTESEKTRDWVAVLAVRREPVSPCKLENYRENSPKSREGAELSVPNISASQ